MFSHQLDYTVPWWSTWPGLLLTLRDMCTWSSVYSCYLTDLLSVVDFRRGEVAQLDPDLDHELLNIVWWSAGSCCSMMWTFYFILCYSCHLPLSLSWPPGFCFHFLSVDRLWKNPITIMAAAAATSTKGSLREDLTCAICCDLFREPVMLACMHHFCKPCISRYWRGTQGPVTCPQCRKEFSSKQFQTNYLVAAMVEKVRATTSDTYIKNLEVSSHLRLYRVYCLTMILWSCWPPSMSLLLVIWRVLLSVWQSYTNNLVLQSKPID